MCMLIVYNILMKYCKGSAVTKNEKNCNYYSRTSLQKSPRQKTTEMLDEIWYTVRGDCQSMRIKDIFESGSFLNISHLKARYYTHTTSRCETFN